MICYDVLMSGFVSPHPAAVVEQVSQKAREERKGWRKQGRTNCLVKAPAKRALNMVPPAELIRTPPSECTNAFSWADVRPKERLRSNMSLDNVLRQCIL